MKTFLYRGVPVIGFASFSGGGKTHLMRQLIPRLSTRGIRTAIVKHAHHDFDIDYPGKDSYELRKAGANQVLVGSNQRWAMIVEKAKSSEPLLVDFLKRLLTVDIELVLVEGFRDGDFPKIEIHRNKLGRNLFYPNDEFIIAIISDNVAMHENRLPTFDIDDVDSITDFLIQYCATAIDMSGRADIPQPQSP